MNKQMLFLLMCVSPVILNGAGNQTQVAANLAIASNETLKKTVAELQKQMAELTAKSQNEFVRGIAVAGTVGAMAYYFLPKAKNRFHIGMGTLGAAAAGYGVNCYYDTLAKLADTLATLAKNNVVVNNPLIAVSICASVGAVLYNYQAVKDTVVSVKQTSGYKWLFDDFQTA